VVERGLAQPIAGVPVRLEGTSLAAVTDEQGTFVLDGVPAGKHTLVAEGPMIEPVRVEVDSARAGPLVIRATYASLPEYSVTVVASRPRPATASTSHVTASEIAAAPRRTAEDALRLVPGLTLVQHGSEGKGHQFFLRGFDAIHGADLEVTVEGVPVNEWSNIHAQGYIDLGFVIPELVQSIDVTKGPFTLGQGAFALAGSADYRLGVPEQDRGLRGGYLVGATNRHRGLVTYSPKSGDGKDFIAATSLHDDGFGQNRDIDGGALLGRFRLFDSARLGTLSVLGSAHLARFGLPGTVRDEDYEAGRVNFDDAYDPAGLGLSARALAAVAYRWRTRTHEVRASLHGGYRRLELLENYTGFLIDPQHGDRRRQEQDSWSFGAALSHELRLRPGLKLRTEIGARGDLLDQRQRHVDQEELALATERALDGAQTITYALAGLRWRPVDRLRLAAGARVDVAHVAVRDGLDQDARGSGTLVAVSPRATAEWRVRTGLRLFAAYGRGFRPPEARAFTSFKPGLVGISEELYHGGEPAMTVSDALELGTRWTPSRYIGVRLSGFGTFIERESVFDHVSGINLELNSTRRLGGELALSSEPLDWLGLEADVTYVDARFVGSGNPIPLAPWLAGGARAVVSHGSGLRAGLRLLGLAPRPLPHGATGAPMIALDATLGYAWRWLRVELELENLLSRRLREGEYHFASHWRPGLEPSRIPVVHYVAGPPLNARLGVSAVF